MISTITAIESKTGVSQQSGEGWTRYTFTFDNQEKAGTFMPEAANFKQGDVVDIITEKSGKYNNIKSMKKADKPAAAPPPSPVSAKPTLPSTPFDVREAAIQTHVAVKCVVDLACAKVIPYDHPLMNRARMYLDKHLPADDNA